MPESQVGEIDPRTEWLAEALHDLSQPLTTLECQLFLSDRDPEASAAALRETIRGALRQSTRMRLLVRGMQDRILQVEAGQGKSYERNTDNPN